MKKLLDSDWLRAVQFKCNTGAKSVTPVQITHRNSGLSLAERQKQIFQANDITKMMTKNLSGNFEKKFSRMRKNGFKKGLPALAPRNFFHVYIINK